MKRFNITKNNARLMLLEPSGSPFLSLGVNHIGAYIEEDPFDLFNTKYNRDWSHLSREVVHNLLDWGFNSAGYHSPSQIQELLPFMSEPFPYPAQIAYWQPDSHYPDVFDPNWHKEVKKIIFYMCEPVKHKENLIGYYWTDTPRWDLETARRSIGKDWVSSIRSIKGSTSGKLRYVEFLLKKYSGDQEFFESIYGEKLSDKNFLCMTDFSKIHLDHYIVQQDDRQFLRLIAREYYRVVGNANRDADDSHLIFGDRYLGGDHPTEVIEEALPWIDVLSIQPLGVEFEEDLFDSLYKISEKPILICDHQSSFYTKEYPRTLWNQLPNESDAARAYHKYLTNAFRKPYLIGYHRCQYIDRYDRYSTLLKQGLIRENEKPYQHLVDQVRITNRTITGE